MSGENERYTRAAFGAGNAVPRRAAFDDLRVGQWVAVLTSDIHGDMIVKGGKVRRTSKGFAYGDDAGWDDLYVSMCAEGRVTVLRDAPAPPVTVRREDYDEAVRLADVTTRALPMDAVTVMVSAKWADDVKEFIRVLIENADTGADR